MDVRLQEYLRGAATVAGRDLERIGPFLATYTRHSVNPFLNYAIPDDGAKPTAVDVSGLVAAFRQRERIPRLEYMPAAAPAVERALVAGGFTVEGRLPVLTCSANSLIDASPVSGVDLIVPSTKAEILGLSRAIAEAYGASGEGATTTEAGEQDAQGVAARSPDIDVLARTTDTGRPIGGGLCSAPIDGLTEIASIGVIPEFRGRGIAGGLASRLAREAFAVGVTTPFLMAAHDAEERIYARVGFSRACEILHIAVRAHSESAATPSGGGGSGS